jgi:hypothetical protein
MCNIALVLNECEALFVVLLEEHELRASEKVVVERISETKGDEIIGVGQNYELRNLLARRYCKDQAKDHAMGNACGTHMIGVYIAFE